MLHWLMEKTSRFELYMLAGVLPILSEWKNKAITKRLNNDIEKLKKEIEELKKT